MRALVVFVAATFLVGCGAESDSLPNGKSDSSATTNADPKANLEKIWAAWRVCKSRTNFAPEDAGQLDKYLKEHGNPSVIRKGIAFRWGYGGGGTEFDKKVAIAWQETSKDGKYYILFGDGKIDRLDEQEMDAHGVTVGKSRERSDKFAPDNIRERLKENEQDWARTKKMYDEDNRKDDAFEKQLRNPKDNKFLEEARKRTLPGELKALAQRRATRKRDYDVKRKVYQEQKKRLEAELKK